MEIVKINEKIIGCDYEFKVVLIGNTAVGKTTLLRRLVTGTFEKNLGATISGDFSNIFYQADKKSVKVQLWDTCGLPQHMSINKTYYRSAKAIIICFDLSDENALETLQLWIEDINQNAPSDIIKFLVGTKADLLKKTISSDILSEIVKKYKIEGMAEVSSKTGEGVQKALEMILRILIENPLCFSSEDSLQMRDRLSVRKSFEKKEEKATCCQHKYQNAFLLLNINNLEWDMIQ